MPARHGQDEAGAFDRQHGRIVILKILMPPRGREGRSRNSGTSERQAWRHGERTVLFLDEIHRFNKSQQDILLGDVESGADYLVGATTENPFFSVNSALVQPQPKSFQF